MAFTILNAVWHPETEITHNQWFFEVCDQNSFNSILFSSNLFMRERLPGNVIVHALYRRTSQGNRPAVNRALRLCPYPCVLGVFFSFSWTDESQCTHTYTLSSTLNTRLLPAYPELDDDVFRESKKKFSPSHSAIGKFRPVVTAVYEVSRNYRFDIRREIE